MYNLPADDHKPINIAELSKFLGFDIKEIQDMCQRGEIPYEQTRWGLRSYNLHAVLAALNAAEERDRTAWAEAVKPAKAV